MPASMCEDVGRDCNLEHLAIGGDIQLHFRPSTEFVTTRKIFCDALYCVKERRAVWMYGIY